MKIVILTQYYPPEIGAPQRRLSDLAERLSQNGHSVTILTAMPNYPIGKIMKGYGGLLKREEVNGITIIRTYIFPTQSAKYILRMLNYISFVLSSLIFGTFLLPRSDYIMVESPPIFLGISGIILSKLKGARLIFNVSDIWPSGLARLKLISDSSLAYKISSHLESLCYRASYVVTCQTKGIMSEINERFPKVSTYHLTNGIALESFGHQERAEAVRKEIADNEHQIVLLYAGLHGLAQALEQILDAAALVQDKNYKFVFIGDGPRKSWLMKYAQDRGINNVLFLAPCEPAKVPAYLVAADVIVVSLKEEYKEAVPSKLYEAMASEKPVLLAAASEACDILSKYNAGLICEPSNPHDIAEKVNELGQNPELRNVLGANGRIAVEKYYNREQIAREFEAYLLKEGMSN